MILTDEEVEDRLASKDNLVNRLAVLRIDPGGRRPGNTNIPPLVKELIVSIDTEETDKEVAESFGISQVSVSAMKRGLTGGGNNASFDPKLAEAGKKNKKIDTAHDAALDCLVDSLNLLKPKLKEVVKPKDLSKIVSDMSKTVSNLKKNDEDAEKGRIQVVVFAPTQKTETHYNTIDV